MTNESADKATILPPTATKLCEAGVADLRSTGLIQLRDGLRKFTDLLDEVVEHPEKASILRQEIARKVSDPVASSVISMMLLKLGLPSECLPQAPMDEEVTEPAGFGPEGPVRSCG